MALGEAQVPIRATLDKLDGDLAQARGKIDGALGNLQKLGKISLGALVGGLAAVTAGATAAAVGIVKLASAAEPLVGLQAGFATVTERIGSSSETMLSALQDASGGLITNRDLMTSFNKAAALVGDQFATVLPEAMGLVQKASLSTGQDMGFLFDSLVTGIGRVSPMILDNLGIQVSLAEVTQHAAEMFGVQAGELTKVQQQTALTDIVMGKLNETYGEVPDVSQPLAQTRVAMANLRDEIGTKLLPVVAPLAMKLLEIAQAVLPVLMDAFANQILPVMIGVSQAFADFFGRIVGGMEPMIAFRGLIFSIGEAFGVKREIMTQVVAKFVELVAGIQAAIATITAIVAPIAAAIGQFVGWQDVLIALGVAIASVIIPAIVSLIAATAPVILTFAAVTAAVALLRTAWEENWLGIQEKTQAVIDFIVPLVNDAIAAVKEWWAQNGEEILANAQAAWQQVQADIQAVIDFVVPLVNDAIAAIKEWWAQNGDELLAKAQQVWGAIKAAVEFYLNATRAVFLAVVGAIQGAWQAHGAQLMAIASAAWGLIKQVISVAMYGIRTTVTTIAAGIQAFWASHGATIRSVAATVWAAIKMAISAALTNIATVLRSFTALFSGNWSGFLSGIQAAWANAMTTIRTILAMLWGQISPILSSMLSNVVAKFQSINWGGVGRAIIDGVIGGISGAAGRLGDAARDAAWRAYQAAKRALGIGSPSKLFWGIGENLSESMAGGVEKMAPEVQSAVGKLADVAGDISKIGADIGGRVRVKAMQDLTTTQRIVTSRVGSMLQPPAFATVAAGAQTGGQMIFQIDARGSEDPAATRRAARRGAEEALKAAGIQAEARIRV